MSKPSPELIDACLVEMQERLDDERIDALRVLSAGYTSRLIIKETYLSAAFKLAVKCGIPVSVVAEPKYGIAVIEAAY